MVFEIPHRCLQYSGPGNQLNQETLYQAGRILGLVIPSDCLNSTWRLAQENLVLVFEQSWQFNFLPYRAEIYANLKPLFLRGPGSALSQSAGAPGSVDRIQILTTR